MQTYRKGTKVQWKWGNGHGTGTVEESFTEDAQRQIKGQTVKRKASKDDPAYLIEQDDGDRVLKGHSELSKAN